MLYSLEIMEIFEIYGKWRPRCMELNNKTYPSYVNRVLNYISIQINTYKYIYILHNFTWMQVCVDYFNNFIVWTYYYKRFINSTRIRYIILIISQVENIFIITHYVGYSITSVTKPSVSILLFVPRTTCFKIKFTKITFVHLHNIRIGHSRFTKFMRPDTERSFHITRIYYNAIRVRVYLINLLQVPT